MTNNLTSKIGRIGKIFGISYLSFVMIDAAVTRMGIAFAETFVNSDRTATRGATQLGINNYEESGTGYKILRVGSHITYTIRNHTVTKEDRELIEETKKELGIN